MGKARTSVHAVVSAGPFHFFNWGLFGLATWTAPAPLLVGILPHADVSKTTFYLK